VRAAIYCRISQDQTGEQLGVTRQQEDCEHLVAAHGWTVAEVFVDNDISASSGKARPAYKRMLAAIEAGQIDALVTWAPDRLYRKLQDLEPLILVMESHGTILKTVRGGEFDMGTPLGRMIARILASVATGEGEVKADRWKRSVRQRREAGAMPGSGPRMKGWTRDGTLLPDEAAEIRWMAQQIIDGASQTALSRAARDRGIRSTAGNVMTKQSIRRLLLNPRLAGYSVLKGDIVGNGTWEPILDVDTWETVRSLLTASAARPTPPRVASLSGLIWCGGCGARMATGSRTTKRGGLSRTYRCTHDAAGNGCMKVAMTAGVVEEVVEAYARERLADPRIRERVEALHAVPKSELAEMTSLQDRLIELERQLEEPGVPVAAIVRAMDRTRQRLAELSDVIARAPMAPLPAVGAPWPTDLQRRRALIGLVVERVTIRPATKPGVVDLERIEIEPR
jgi:site-specific DNA recombinase